MAATQSTMLPLGTLAPEFSLPDSISGQRFSLQNLRGEKGSLIMFICNHCPYVMHIKQELIAIAQEYRQKGIASIAISANDISQYPEDGPDKMQVLMAEWGNPFAAYLYDESQNTARAYQAACTPDFYLFDADLVCVYRGRLDGATPQNAVPVNGMELRGALEDLLHGRPCSAEQIPSIGCNIKWRSA
jgi:thiol-disulfide isomerase/thioredoxin